MSQKKTNGKKGKEFRFNINIRTFFILLFIGLFLYFSYQSIAGEIKKALPEKSLTAVLTDIKANKVEKVEVIENKVLVHYKNKEIAITHKEEGEGFVTTMKDSGVNPNSVQVVVKDTQGSAGLINFLSNFIPTLLMIAFFVFLFRHNLILAGFGRIGYPYRAIPFICFR